MKLMIFILFFFEKFKIKFEIKQLCSEIEYYNKKYQFYIDNDFPILADYYCDIIWELNNVLKIKNDTLRVLKLNY